MSLIGSISCNFAQNTIHHFRQMPHKAAKKLIVLPGREHFPQKPKDSAFR